MTIARLIANRSGEIHSCHAGDSVATAVALLAAHRIGAVPVHDQERDVVIGIFSERDVLYCLNSKGAGALELSVREVMTAPPVTVERSTPVDDALALMTRRRFRHLPVVENGRMVGFVSIGDLVKYRADRIEAEAAAMRSYIQSA